MVCGTEATNTCNYCCHQEKLTHCLLRQRWQTTAHYVVMRTSMQLVLLMQGLTQMMYYIVIYQSAKQAKQASAEGLRQEALQSAVAAHALPLLRRAHTLQLLVSGQSAATAFSSAPCNVQKLLKVNFKATLDVLKLLLLGLKQTCSDGICQPGCSEHQVGDSSHFINPQLYMQLRFAVQQEDEKEDY